MTEMDIQEELRKEFLSHPYYSPRHHTFIVVSLEKMNGTLGRENFIRKTLAANSETEALTFQ